jgi:hypothetical protein
MEKKKEMAAKVQTFTVLKEVTVDKFYQVGSTIKLTDRKTIEVMKSHKFIN